MLEVCLGGGVQVQNGKGAMPAWKDTLDDDEIEAVANYVFETAKADGW
jgi:mono/diheme cytochrome c family protein